MTPTTMPGYTPYLIAALAAFVLYRRIRGSVGRQNWHPALAAARLALLSAVMLLIVLATFGRPSSGGIIAIAALAGIGLGAISLRLMRVERVGGVRTYLPDPWLVTGLSALLLGRLACRYAQGDFSGPAPTYNTATMAIAALVVAFYLMQGTGLFRRMKRLPPSGSAPG